MQFCGIKRFFALCDTKKIIKKFSQPIPTHLYFALLLAKSKFCTKMFPLIALSAGHLAVGQWTSSTLFTSALKTRQTRIGMINQMIFQNVKKRYQISLPNKESANRSN